MSDLSTVEISQCRKKWTLFNEMQATCIESEEDRNRVSSYLVEDSDVEWLPTVEPPTLIVPYEEFRNLLFFLPKFHELPIFTNAYKSAGEPNQFIVRCFDGGDDQAGDELYIDRSGYEYARYKSAVKRAVINESR